MHNKKIQLQFLIVLLVGAVILVFFIFKPFLAPLALATVFAVILQPIYRYFTRIFGGRESIASFVTVVLSIVCLLIPCFFLGTQIFQESRQLYSSLINTSGTDVAAGAIQKIGHNINNYIPGAESAAVSISENIDAYSKQGLSWLINNLATALSGFSALLVDLSIFVIALYYLLRDGYKLKKSLILLSPLEDSDDEKVFGRLERAVSSVLKGNMIVAIIQGSMTTIGLLVFGVPNAFLLGMVAGIASFIPGFGTAIVIIPSIIFLFVIGHTISAIGLIVWGMLGVGLIDNLLGPKLISHNTELHPLFVLLSVLGGIVFFGPIGIILGPLCLSLLLAFIRIYTFFTEKMYK